MYVFYTVILINVNKGPHLNQPLLNWEYPVKIFVQIK